MLSILSEEIMKKYSLIAAVFFVFTINPSVFASSATAVIHGTEPGSQISGQATFQETPQGLKVTAQVSHLSPGKHGFHIHQNGACGDGGKAAGGHFNPDNAPHGLLLKDGLSHAHAGDLGNIEVGADGNGKLEETIPSLTLSEGKYSVAGKSVILHAKEDDLAGQPAGNAGDRIGCGEITPDK